MQQEVVHVSSAAAQQGGFRDEAHPTLIAEATALRSILNDLAPKHEEIGKLTDEAVSLLHNIGAFRMAAPARDGGMCLSADLMSNVLREIARGCPSSGWVVSIVNSSIWVASVLAPAMEQNLFQDGVPRMCSPTNGMGLLIAEGGKLVLNGKWAYGSGAHHCEWALVPAKTESGMLNMVAVRMSDVRIENSWLVAGMKGTGSDTVVADGVTIEVDQYCEISPVGEAPDRDISHFTEASDFRNGIGLLRIGIAAVLVGAAEGLLDAVMATQSKGVLFSPHQTRAASELYRAKIGRAAAMIRLARSALDRSAAMHDNAAAARVHASVAQRAETRAELTLSVDLLLDAGQSLMTLCGSSGFANSSPAQRFWRDLNVGARHIVFQHDAGFDVYGSLKMGIEPLGYSLDRI